MLLAIPMVLEMAMESVFALTDAFFVSRLGTDAVATVGLTEAMVTLLFAVAGGMSIATTAMVARRIGEKDYNGARVAAAQALLIGIGISALMLSNVCLGETGAEILAIDIAQAIRDTLRAQGSAI